MTTEEKERKEEVNPLRPVSVARTDKLYVIKKGSNRLDRLDRSRKKREEIERDREREDIIYEIIYNINRFII